MGSPPKPLLVAVTAILGLTGAAGFSLGLSGAMARRRPASAALDQTPIAGNIPPGAKIQDAQPYVPAQAAPPNKAKAAEDDDDDSDKAASDAPAEPAPKAPPAPAPPPPAEAAPGVPPSSPPVASPKLPDDLPPT